MHDMIKKVALSFAVLVLVGLTAHSAVRAQEVNRDGDVVYLGTTTTATTNSATITTGLGAASGPTIYQLGGYTIEIPAGYFPDFKTLMTWLLQVALVVSVLLVLFQLVYAGINWITSGGDKGKTDTARGRIVAAIIGLVIVVASWAIFLFVLQLIGIAPGTVLPSLS